MFQQLACGGCNLPLHPHDVDYVDDWSGESFCSTCMTGGVAHARVLSGKPAAPNLAAVLATPKRSVADIVFGVGGGSNLTPA